MSEPTQEQPAVTPEVTTAPAGSAWSRVPDHLGPARTSTVVLAVLFVAIFALYLNIRPDTTGTATAGTSNPVPASTTVPAPEPTATTTPAPETTQEQQPTTTAESTTTGGSTETTAPEPTTESVVPAPTGTTPRATLPSATLSPPGG